MTLGQRLKKARERTHLTQMDVANRLGISNGTLSGYERDYRDPDTDTLIKLADLYDVSINWLLGKENNKESAYTLPESDIERVIKETEDQYNVNLHDDPVVLAAMKQMIQMLAEAKSKEQKS